MKKAIRALVWNGFISYLEVLVAFIFMANTLFFLCRKRRATFPILSSRTVPNFAPFICIVFLWTKQLRFTNRVQIETGPSVGITEPSSSDRTQPSRTEIVTEMHLATLITPSICINNEQVASDGSVRRLHGDSPIFAICSISNPSSQWHYHTEKNKASKKIHYNFMVLFVSEFIAT